MDTHAYISACKLFQETRCTQALAHASFEIDYKCYKWAINISLKTLVILLHQFQISFLQQVSVFAIANTNMYQHMEI